MQTIFDLLLLISEKHALDQPTAARKRYFSAGVLSVFLLIPLLSACGTSGSTATSTQNSGGDLSGHVLAVGSTALLPLAAKAAALFHQAHPSVRLDVQGGGSITGLNAMANHQADIGDSDIFADPALYPDPDLTDHIVCVVAFTLIVDPQVDLTALSTSQILAVFTGKVKNWKEVGGPDLSIKPIIRPSTSGTRALFRKYVLGGAAENGPTLTSDSSTAVLDTVAHTPGAIGYVTTTLLNSTVHAIGIDGIAATVQNIQSGKYKFWGYEHMYTLENGINATTAFLDFMNSPSAQQLAQQMGYIPVSAIKTASVQKV